MSSMVILDNGSHEIRAGFSSDCAPRLVMLNQIGNPKCSVPVMTAKTSQEYFTGEELRVKRGLLKMQKSFESDRNCDIGVLSNVWHHALINELRIQPEEHELIITDQPGGSIRSKHNFVHLIFEHFNFRGASIVDSSLMNLFSCGLSNGISFDIAEYETRINAFWSGFALNEVRSSTPVAGKAIDLTLKRLFEKKGIQLNSFTKNDELIRDLKEKYCFVISNKHNHHFTQNRLDVQLPDGNRYDVYNELCKSVEVLFDPLQNCIEGQSLPELVIDAVKKCPIDTRKNIFQNIVMCGATSLVSGLKNRIRSELPAKYKIKSTQGPQYATWTGASIFSSLDSFNWVSKETYFEYGPSVAERFCFC